MSFADKQSDEKQEESCNAEQEDVGFHIPGLFVFQRVFGMEG